MTTTATSFPIGTIVPIIASPTSPPTGWLCCNGQHFDPSLYPDLASHLGSNTLPDLQGRTIIGASATYTQLSTTGLPEVTLTLDQMPSHQHYGWGEVGGFPGLGFGASVKQGYLGSGKYDSDNYLYGSTFSGGQTDDTNQKIPVSVPYSVPDDSPYRYTLNAPVQNNAVSVMQPSMAINYFIYAGSPVVAT